MFTTLLKWEWKSTGLIVSVITAVFVGIIAVMFGGLLWTGTENGAAVFSLFAFIVAIIYTTAIFVILMADYYKKMHGEHATMTHMLPVTTGQLLGVKTLYMSLAYLIAVALTFALGFLWVMAILIWFGATTAPDIIAGFSELDFLDLFDVGFFITLIGLLNLILGVVFWQFVLTAGNHPRMKRIGKFAGPFIVYIVAQIATQVIGVVFSFIIPLSVNFVGNKTEGVDLELIPGWSPIVLSDSDTTYPFGLLIYVLVLIPALWWTTKWILDRKLSV